MQLALAAVVVLDTAVSAAVAASLLATLFAGAGITRLALQGSLTVVMEMPPEPAGIAGPGSLTMIRLNRIRRAQFMVASARRLMAGLAEARSRNENLAAALYRLLQTERRYYGQHMDAIWARKMAAARVDAAVLDYGRLLGWHTVLDARTSAECKWANGRNFLADQMPWLGYPGAVHPHCRCYPGRPFPGGALLPSVSPRMVLAA